MSAQMNQRLVQFTVVDSDMMMQKDNEILGATQQ